MLRILSPKEREPTAHKVFSGDGCNGGGHCHLWEGGPGSWCYLGGNPAMSGRPQKEKVTSGIIKDASKI